MNIDWLMILKAFCVGGVICIIGQILIDKTKLTPARILVTYVTLGAILGGPYSRMIAGLKKANVTINRKMLSEIAVSDSKAFAELAEIAKKA